jgi:hypothetical protein
MVSEILADIIQCVDRLEWSIKLLVCACQVHIAADERLLECHLSFGYVIVLRYLVYTGLLNAYVTERVSGHCQYWGHCKAVTCVTLTEFGY